MDRADDAAFAEFVAGAGDRLARSAYLLAGGDRAAADDLLQGALERTYRHWPRVRRGGVPEAYVRRALVNATITGRRRRKLIREEPLEAAGDGPADRGDVGALLADRDQVVRAVRGLPPRQRAVVVLRYLDDQSEADVAAALGCSVGAVKSQASRALAKLRAELAQEYPDRAAVSGRRAL